MDSRRLETVLVVDDERLIRVLAQLGLERYGYKVFAAESGEAGCRMFAEHQDEIDLVLSDVLLPDLSGLEMASIMLRQKPSLKVVFFTATIDAVDEFTLRSRPVLMKPVLVSDLAKTIRESLDDVSTSAGA